MSERHLVEQPPAGFNYDYWFSCENCGKRVHVTAQDFAQQCSATLPYPVCDCGTEVDITESSPTLRDCTDVALQTEMVDRVYWYHTSRYEGWPDPASYTADLVNLMARSGAGFVRERILELQTSLALHLGTYEAAIENMLRRMGNQDGVPIQYWLHRVELNLEAGDLTDSVGEELPSMMGDVALSQVHEQGGRAVRYINVHEAHGSISLAVDPGVIGRVVSIALPLPSAAASAISEHAAATAVASLAELDGLRPDTSGIAPTRLRLDGLRASPSNPDDPESVQRHTIARQFRAYESQVGSVWADLTDVLASEHLVGLNPLVRERFLRAVRHDGGDPIEFHQRFREMAGLLANASEVRASFRSVAG